MTLSWTRCQGHRRCEPRQWANLEAALLGAVLQHSASLATQSGIKGSAVLKMLRLQAAYQCLYRCGAMA